MEGVDNLDVNISPFDKCHNPFKEYIALCFCLVLFDRYI